MDDPSLFRASVPAMNDLLGKQLPVIGSGFVRLVDYMGDDNAIVQAARVSYGDGTKQLRADRGLIRYLMRNGHTSPFEMCEVKLHVRVPMDVWRQWIRHRTASVNEYSTRYSVAIDDALKTRSDEWRLQSGSNKQGSKGFIEPGNGEIFSIQEADLQRRARSVYEGRIASGIAREQARKDLPLSTFTEAYWKIDLHNLLNFLRLRLDHHAQHEIRAYATVISNEIVKVWCPIAWEAFSDYQLKSISISEIEIRILNLARSERPVALRSYLIDAGFSKDGEVVEFTTEGIELQAKLLRLGCDLRSILEELK